MGGACVRIITYTYKFCLEETICKTQAQMVITLVCFLPSLLQLYIRNFYDTFHILVHWIS
jgi:hypothetical protein